MHACTRKQAFLSLRPRKAANIGFFKTVCSLAPPPERPRQPRPAFFVSALGPPSSTAINVDSMQVYFGMSEHGTEPWALSWSTA